MKKFFHSSTDILYIQSLPQVSINEINKSHLRKSANVNADSHGSNGTMVKRYNSFSYLDRGSSIILPTWYNVSLMFFVGLSEKQVAVFWLYHAQKSYNQTISSFFL